MKFFLVHYQALHFEHFFLKSMEIELFSQTLLNNCFAINQTIDTFTLLNLMLKVYIRPWCLNKRSSPRREEAESPSNYEHQKLQKLCTQGGAAYGSVQNLVKACSLPVSKLRKVWHSKPSLKNLNLPLVKTRDWKDLLNTQRKPVLWIDPLIVDNLAKV